MPLHRRTHPRGPRPGPPPLRRIRVSPRSVNQIGCGRRQASPASLRYSSSDFAGRSAHSV
jgi:hypothetical protein